MIDARRALTALALIAASVPAHAAVIISTAPTQNMNCSDGTCVPTATKAVLNASDLENDLSQFGNMRVMTTGSGVEANNIELRAAFTSPDSTSLTLEAHKTITVDAAVSIGSGTAELELQSDSKGASHTLSFGKKGHITFGSLSDIFGINGGIFTLVDSVQGLAATIAANPSGFYALANNYDASGDGTYAKSPITTVFEGTFQGLGNTISHLQINDPNNDPVGLFEYIDTPASVLNLRLTKANIAEADEAVGVLAGWGNGYLYGDTTDGTVSGRGAYAGGLIGLAGAASGTSTIVQCASAANVESGSYAGGLVGRIGGFVGHINGTVSDSSASGTVDSKGQGVYGGLAGGLVGYLELGEITASFATGAVSAEGGDRKKRGALAGGLIGAILEDVSLANSYATGPVTGSTYSHVGGLVGFNYAGQSYGTSVIDSYATGALSGDNVGGLVGSDWHDSDCNCYSDTYWDTDTSGVTNRGVGNVRNEPGVTGLTTVEFQSGLPNGFDPAIWAEDTSINNGLPYLTANPPPK